MGYFIGHELIIWILMVLFTLTLIVEIALKLWAIKQLQRYDGFDNIAIISQEESQKKIFRVKDK